MKRIIVIIFMIALNLTAETSSQKVPSSHGDDENLFGNEDSGKLVRYINPAGFFRFPETPMNSLVYINSLLHDYSAFITLNSSKVEDNEIQFHFKVIAYFSKIDRDNEVFSFSLHKDNQLCKELEKNIGKAGYLIFADFGNLNELYNIKLYLYNEIMRKTRYSYDNILKTLKENHNEKTFKALHLMFSDRLKELLARRHPVIEYFQDLVNMGYEKMIKIYPYSAPIIKGYFDKNIGKSFIIKDGTVDYIYIEHDNINTVIE